MYYLKASLLSAVLILGQNSYGTPVLKNPRVSTTLQERDDPKPSSYPGTGTEFTNEWKYVNFDMSKDDDKKNVEIIHNAFDGMRRNALAGLSSAIGKDKVFLRFFDDDDDDKNDVINVLRQIIPEKNEDGSPNSNANVGPLVAANVVIDNEDFNKGKEGEPNCDDEGTFAYTDADKGRTHFCPLGLALQDATKLSCESPLDDFVSSKMDNTGRLALHETLHVKKITTPKLDDPIIDAKNKDGEGAFGPERAFALVHGDPPDGDPGSGENIGLATVNADNYAWMACNAFMEDKHCKQGAFDDPKAY